MDKFTINVKNGFYVGDLCYALSDEVYHGVWGANNYEIGKYEYDGKEFAMVNTAYGDGCYLGSDLREYPVDAGIIGICDAELAKKDFGNLGRIIQYSGEVTIAYDDVSGTIYISYGDEAIAIPTIEDEFGYEDDWPDYSDEEEDEEDRW